MGQPLGWQCQDNPPLSSVPLRNLAPSGEGRTGQDPTAFLSSWGADKHRGIWGGSVGLVWCFFGIQSRSSIPRWDVPRQPLCPGQWGARAPRAGEGEQLPYAQVSHSQGSSLSQLSWSQMLVGANPPGCLSPNAAGELAEHLQTQPTGKLSQHCCMLEP